MAEKVRQTSARNPSAWDTPNLVSRYLLIHLWPTIRLGLDRKLDMSAVTRPSEGDKSSLLGVRLAANYNKLSQGPAAIHRRLVIAVLASFWAPMAMTMAFEIMAQCLFAPLQILALGWLTRDAGLYFEALQNHRLKATLNHNTTATVAQLKQSDTLVLDELQASIVADAALLLGSAIGLMLTDHVMRLRSFHVDMQFRVAICQMMYAKSLKLCPKSALHNRISTGQMVNLLSNDINKIEGVMNSLAKAVSAPIQVIEVFLLIAFVYMNMSSAIAAFATMACYISLHSLVARWFARVRRQNALRTDLRIRLSNELIQAIKFVKMYAWEWPLLSRIEFARARELKSMARVFKLSTVNAALAFGSGKAISLVAMSTFLLVNSTDYITVHGAFVLMALSNQIRNSLTVDFPVSLQTLAEALVSCERFDSYLAMPETTHTQTGELGATPVVSGMFSAHSEHSTNGGLVMKAVELPLSLAPDSEQPCQELLDTNGNTNAVVSNHSIRGLTMSTIPGDLVLIVGPVGCGKTSTLMAILGELKPSAGLVQLPVSVSYASQEPWVFSGTIRDNILLGKQFDELRYERVLDSCSLRADLKRFDNGDLTVVSSRGSSLSGGQRSRLNLARALYHEAQVYVLDDPLSALDTEIASRVFATAIQGFLLGKTVIMTTNQLHQTRFASKIVHIDADHNAKIFDSYESFVKATDLQAEEPATHTGTETSGSKSATLEEFSSAEVNQTDGKEQVNDANEALVDVSQNLSSYVYYLRNGFSLSSLIVLLVVHSMAHVMLQALMFFYGWWSASVQRKQSPNFEPLDWVDSLNLRESLSLAGALMLACTLLAVLRAWLFFVGALRASKNMHNKLLNYLSLAPMSFYDSRPVGILLNRISRDMGSLDCRFPVFFVDCLGAIMYVLVTLLVTVILDGRNWMAALAFPSIVLYLRYRLVHIVLRLKQMEAIARSPLYSHLSTTIDGLTQIRVFKVQRDFEAKFCEAQDLHTSAWWTHYCSARLYLLLVDLSCMVFVILVVATKLLFSLHNTNSSEMSFLLIQLINLRQPLIFGLSQLLRLEIESISVQRIQEYSQTTGQQPIEPVKMPSRQLQLKGHLKFVNVTLRYNPNSKESSPSLNEISFEIEPGERVGILGRTGAGKSSLMASILRLYDFDGRVEIDGHDSKLIALGDLRSSIGVVPQEPVIFSGTLRYNLDPKGSVSEFELEDVLKAVQLSPMLQLSSEILDNGKNLSLGQRQLICLARVLLHNNKLVVLDEPTASLDLETDLLIQKIINERLTNCTVLIIAHRLNTVMSCDKVMLLSDGKVVEFGAPVELMQLEAGLFRRMVESRM